MNLPPSESQGWTLTSIERDSRYWVTAQVSLKDDELFTQGVKTSWQWAEPSQFIRWFSDGERRYGKALWYLASGWLTYKAVSRPYGHLKVAARGTRSGN